jgi:hypothetical protein
MATSRATFQPNNLRHLGLSSTAAGTRYIAHRILSAVEPCLYLLELHRAVFLSRLALVPYIRQVQLRCYVFTVLLHPRVDVELLFLRFSGVVRGDDEGRGRSR